MQLPFNSAEFNCWSTLGTVLLAALYVAISTVLINFNKYLVRADRFPFPLPLSIVQTAIGLVFSGLLFAVWPSMLPALTGAGGVHRVRLDAALLKTVGPLSTVFSMQIILSNTACMDGSVAFLQMMKAGNLVLIFLLSWLVRLEMATVPKLATVSLLVVATTATIRGEVQFSATAFGFQLASQFFESTKLVLQNLAMADSRRKLDALSYIFLTSPLCLVQIGMFYAAALTIYPGTHFAVPEQAVVLAWLPLLLLNGCVACALNIVLACFVQRTSSMTVVLANIVKTAAIVTYSTQVLGENINRMQQCGFMMQLLLIAFWSYLKAAQPGGEGKAIEVSVGLRKNAALVGAIHEINKHRRSYGATAEETDRNEPAV